jgi:hypothetical protein
MDIDDSDDSFTENSVSDEVLNTNEDIFNGMKQIQFNDCERQRTIEIISDSSQEDLENIEGESGGTRQTIRGDFCENCRNFQTPVCKD